MRLDKDQRDLIVNTLKMTIDDAAIYLFGSRTDDSKRGGDIDIFLLTNRNLMLSDKIKLLTQLELKGIERKVDLVISSPEHRQEKIFNEVMEKGIRLC